MAKTTEVLVTNSAGGTRLDPTPIVGRRFVLIHNYGPNPIHVSFGVPVAAKGMRVPAAAAGVPGALGPLEVSEFAQLTALADTAAQITGAATVVSEW
jgi:hypothetical protein